MRRHTKRAAKPEWNFFVTSGKWYGGYSWRQGKGGGLEVLHAEHHGGVLFSWARALSALKRCLPFMHHMTLFAILKALKNLKPFVLQERMHSTSEIAGLYVNN